MNPHPLPWRPHPRHRVVITLLVAAAWLCVPVVSGCDHPTRALTPEPSTPKPAPTAPIRPEQPSPTTPSSGRNIQFQGLDHDYRGSTRVMPNDRVIHRKDADD
ncbi:MAG: hypothetical protein B7Z55_00155 [Planctomycetales bacterium 12-60-4]|nr:MAG: hypothetical protein B7Z55_00155 [Planctomycetales bacterium 12-60-4]